MGLTDAQRELLEDKFVLWTKAAREFGSGPDAEMRRDYNRRAAEALKVALSLASAADEADSSLTPPTLEARSQAETDVTRALHRLSGAAYDMLIGIDVHNRLSPDSPGRLKNIEGPVVSELSAAAHAARALLQSHQGQKP